MRKLFFLLAFVATIIGCNKNKTYPKGTYPLGKLEGVTVSDLYAQYLGVENDTKLQENLKTDFLENFKILWNIKIKKSNSSVVEKTAEELVTEYESGVTFTNFNKYKNYLSTIVTDLKKDIDWSVVKQRMNMSDAEAKLVEEISLSISSKDIMAYLMTELLPSSNGKLNKAFLDFLLRNAGKEYIEGIPAIYDKKCSFGPYQFTEYALFNTEKEKRGASIINLALPNSQKIPGSVMLLRDGDHHKAAYLFCVYNICLLIKGLDDHELNGLKRLWKGNKDDLFLYCATAHHNPSRAREAAKNWLKNQAKLPFENSCSSRILYYAQKTRANLSVI